MKKEIESVLIVEEYYKKHTGGAIIFINRHPNKNINQLTVTKMVNKFKTYGSIQNNFNKKTPKTGC